MLIKELVTRLGFDVDFGPLKKFDQSIDQTKEGLNEMGAAADEAVQQVKSALVTIRNTLIGFTVATAAGGAALFALVKSAANTGDEINKLAPMLGFNVEEFQKYRYAAKLAGVENENFAQSTQLLLRNIAEAGQGNKEVQKAFARLGLDPAKLRGKSTAEVLRQVSERLSGIEDNATRVSLSMDLLGRSGARMGAFLAKGTEHMDAIMADVEAFGMFTAESAQSAEDFNDSLTRVLFFFRGIKNEIAQGLFPVFRGMLDDIREWLSLNREAIKAGLSRAIQVLTAVITRSWNLLKGVVRSLQTIVRAMGGLKNALYLIGIGILSPILLLLGPLAVLTRGLFFLLIPFIRLHTLLALVTFAMSALAPLFAILTSAVAALAATKLIAWLVMLAGGYRALAVAMIIPTVSFLLQAAAIAFLILTIEDLYTWMKGGKSVIGLWLGQWDEAVARLRQIWTDIKAIFQSGGEFMAAVFSGDFRKAYEILQKGTEQVGNLAESGADLVSGGRGGAAFAPGGNGQGAGGWGMLSPFNSMTYGMAGAPAAASPVPGSFRLGDVLDRSGNMRPQGPAIIKQAVTAKVDVILPKGTPEEHAADVAKAFKGLMDKEVDHSLQHSVLPGR